MAAYTANNLNQYTSRDYPGTNDIIGAALATNAVTVNGQTAFHKGEYFWGTAKTNNTTAPQWVGVTVASGGNTNNGNLLFAKTPQVFTYDADGNQTSDGLWTNTWDAENRLIETESLASVPAAARMKEEWSYLPDGRWSQRIVSSWNGSAYVPQATNRFVWDDKVLLAIVDQINGLTMSFLRGTDLSGTMQGAGGVGGLLAVTFKTNGTHFVAFDGNGNVAALINAADGTQSANYEYGAFGEPIRITGTVGFLNPIGFSTQFRDDVVKGDVKFLYRPLGTSIGGWLSKDPMQEAGGINIYVFTANNPISKVDTLGLFGPTVHFGATIGWADAAHFANDYDVIIAGADEGTDDNFATGVKDPKDGGVDRHMNQPSKHGMDSRVYWYNTERKNALIALDASDKDHQVSHCVDAANAFGRGLHSLQDMSAHRDWPMGGDWPWPVWPGSATFSVHPRWWDDWYGQVNSGDGDPAEEQLWANYFAGHPGNDDYNIWTGSATQIASQNRARSLAESRSTGALNWFAHEVRKHCACANVMLDN